MECARILEENLLHFDSLSSLNCISNYTENCSGSNIKMLCSKSGHLVPKIKGDSGKWFTIHSLVDPLEEARRFTSTLEFSSNTILVILGVGMGYHVEQVIKSTHKQPLVFVEKEPCLLKAFFSSIRLKQYCVNREIYFVTGKDWENVVSTISHIQARCNYLPFSIVHHIPSCRAYNKFYGKISGKLNAAATLNITAKLRYSKFQTDKLRILIINSKYYLLGEIYNSLIKMNHQVRVVMIEADKGKEGKQDVIENIITEILSFRPDFILTVNHLGFDREGILTRFFTDIEMPYASWYVDSPVFILEDFKKQISPYLTIFVWDTDYINDLKNQGFENVYPLPLATDPDIFKKTTGRSNPFQYLKCAVGFVGNSGEKIISQCMDEINQEKLPKRLLDKIALQYIDSEKRFVGDLELKLNNDEQQRYEWCMSNMKDVIEPAVTWRATQIYRLACVEKLLSFAPHIHGDPGWKSFLNGDAVMQPELNYYSELPFFYNVCKINFNTTSLQMKNGLNQRVFDVPACNAFLLTDYKAQIDEMFTEGSEVICYKHPDEIEGLTKFYLKNSSERKNIARKAYKRVLKDHTYIIRLNKLLSQMKKLYGQ